MGRLLLALALSQVVSPVAWLSLSATISNRKGQYYRAFVESEHPLNRGDVTTFVETMLDIVVESLGSLRQDLAERSDQLARLGEQMGACRMAAELRKRNCTTDFVACSSCLGKHCCSARRGI